MYTVRLWPENPVYQHVKKDARIYWYFHGIQTCENELSILVEAVQHQWISHNKCLASSQAFSQFLMCLCSHFTSKYYCECKQEDKNRGGLEMRLMNVGVTVLIRDDGSPFSITTCGEYYQVLHFLDHSDNIVTSNT